jgi:predicted ArsR family transcriptional regulator
MLTKILELLNKGELHTTADLARELGVSQELVNIMVADLARRGYLRQVTGDCPEHCATCPLGNTCAVGGPGQVWALTQAKS